MDSLALNRFLRQITPYALNAGLSANAPVCGQAPSASGHLYRVAAVLRRVNGESETSLICGPIVLSVARHEVLCAGIEIELSPTEFRLLEYLMENKNRVLTKQQMLDAVWGIDFDSSTTVLETFISYLRKKMSPEIDNMLVTVRGIGFKLVDKT